ncbi:MAG: hypothetical protein J5758_02445 [Abditibacteriota bacterium]|nr:hypothetical protein [Abditibacteriota bacterium]
MKKILLALWAALLAAGALGAFPRPGDIVTLGSWPCTAEGEKKPVEWIAVPVPEDLDGDGLVLLVSRLVLDGFPAEGLPLDTFLSPLTEWLNGEFAEVCFEDCLQVPAGGVLIPPVSPPWENGGDNSLFESAALRKAAATPWAAKRGVPVDAEGCSPWILCTEDKIRDNFGYYRDPEGWDGRYTRVSGYGSPLNGPLTRYPSIGVRPMIAIKKSAKVPVTGHIQAPEFRTAGKAKPYAAPALLKRGDAISFGRAEQDGNAANGKEPIEWLVLDAGDGKALAVSKKILYELRHGDDTPRGFLNGEFLAGAFSDSERALILPAEHDYCGCDMTDDGEAKLTLADSCFLLSLHELDMLFPTAKARKSVCTPAALKSLPADAVKYYKDRFATRDDFGSWAEITDKGRVRFFGSHHQEQYAGLRPALWIKTDRRAGEDSLPDAIYREMAAAETSMSLYMRESHGVYVDTSSEQPDTGGGQPPLK